MKTKLVYAIITFVSVMLMLPIGGYAKTYKGTIFVEVGKQYSVDVSYGSYVTQSGYWSKSNSTFIFVSQGQRSCTIRGNKVGSGTLEYWGFVNADKVEYYWDVVVTPTQPKLKVSATPSGGGIISGDKVYLTASADGSTMSDAEIYYTTDGTTPSMNSTYYKSSGVTINQACTLKAIAYKGGYETSDVGSWNYTIEVEVAAINATNFPDDNFRNYLLEQDYGKDGRLTEREIKNVTSLSVGNREIHSLQGIEYFTALTWLYCYNNQLTALDVSKNTALWYLNCSVNQLTSLDVSKNTVLKELYCGGNLLMTLDVSKNTKLEWLSCNSNQLTALDVSGCTALRRVECNDNQLTTLDVSKNTTLTKLYCSKNQLITLDVSRNTTLKELYCSKNQLTALGVSRCTALRQAECDNNQLTELDVSKNTTLNKLFCGSNQLTALDVSKNTKLEWLSCYNNQLTALDISKNTALIRLSCSKNQLTALDVSKNTALTELNCDHNQLTTLDVSKNTALTELDCPFNQLTALDVSKNTALTRLVCRYNQLTALDVSKNTALTNLSCSDNQLTALDVSKNTALTELDCGYNQLTTLDVSKNTELRTLYVYVNQIKGASMDNFINSLPTQEEAKLYVYYLYKDEGNVCTKEQVKTAKKKGWRVFTGNGYEYEGSDDTSSNIDGIRTEADKDAPVYNLQGERLTAPQKGVNIIGGRKVVVK